MKIEAGSQGARRLKQRKKGRESRARRFSPEGCGQLCHQCCFSAWRLLLPDGERHHADACERGGGKEERYQAPGTRADSNGDAMGVQRAQSVAAGPRRLRPSPLPTAAPTPARTQSDASERPALRVWESGMLAARLMGAGLQRQRVQALSTGQRESMLRECCRAAGATAAHKVAFGGRGAIARRR